MPSGAAKEMDSPAPPLCWDLIQGIGCIRPFAFAARPSGPARPTGFPSMARRLHLYISAFPDWEYVSAYAATGLHPQRTTPLHGYTPTGLHAAAQPNGGRAAHGRPRAMLPFLREVPHTFATQLIRHGGDIKALQSIFGHKDAMVTLNVYADIEPMSKIQNMLRVSPSLWRGYLGLRVDPGPMFQQKIREAIETLEAFGYGISEPDDRNVLIRDVQTISRLYPTEYAAVLGAIPTEATVVE